MLHVSSAERHATGEPHKEAMNLHLKNIGKSEEECASPVGEGLAPPPPPKKIV